MIQKDLEVALYTAFREAQDRRNEYLTLEHLLYVLCFDKLSRRILKASGANPDALKKDLDEFLDTQLEALPEGHNVEPTQTRAFQRVMQRAILHVQSSGKDEVDGGNVLVALFAERDSYAVYYLERHGVSRLDLVSYLSHGHTKDSDSSDEEEQWYEDGDYDDEDRKKDPLEEHCTNLVELATQGKIDPLIGRDAEIERTIQILCRRKKNNPVLVGEPGVGKTAIAEGLARRISEGDVPAVLKDAIVYSLNMGTALAGTRYRGEFEDKLTDIVDALKESDNAILFIDEIHTIVRAGATEGGAMDASNILKPALAAGDLRCIGATTHDEYRRSFDKDRALSRRFQKIDVNEPSLEDTKAILRGLKKYYEDFHEVEYTEEAIDAAALLAQRHIRDNANPDKAIDLIDEAGARYRAFDSADASNVIGESQIETIVSKIARIPDLTVKGDDRENLAKLEETLKTAVYGQDEAIEAVVTAVKMSRAGLTRPDKPVGNFIFAGPTGVGKTEVAKQLAQTLGVEFIRFDMSEYMERHAVSRLIGAPPGYVGFEGGGQLTEAVRKNPNAVLLLDEVEKAHPDIHNILLQIMDAARLTDNNGREADFRNIILIMTSNAGAFEMAQATVGFGKGVDVSKGKSAIDKMFPPEFRNRLDGIITFNPLQPEVMGRIVDKFMGELEEQLGEKEITFDLTPGAREWLGEKGYDEKLGARPLSRVIQDHIKHPLANEILFGSLQEGGTVEIYVKDDELAFAFPDSDDVESSEEE